MGAPSSADSPTPISAPETMNMVSDPLVAASTNMPTVITDTPARITTFEPSRSSNRPASGAPTLSASTTGISRKLATEGATPSAATASSGRNTRLASPSPAPAVSA